MDKKIIFFDIDDTIYNSQGISDKTKEAIKLLNKNGHLAFISTGRPMSMLEEFLDMGFDGVNAACGNYIVCNNELMFNNEIPDYIVDEIIKLIQKNNLYITFEGKDALYTDKKDNSNPFLRFNLDFKVKDWLEEKVKANKFSLDMTNNHDGFNKIESYFSQYFTIIRRGNDFAELVPKGYSKATGIKYIIEYLDIPWENTYAFGDSENDLDMMKYVCNSVAMGNAVEEIKKVSKYVTDTIYNEGVYKGLKMLELI